MTVSIKIESYILQNEMEIDVPKSIRKSMARVHQKNLDRICLETLCGESAFTDKWKVRRPLPVHKEAAEKSIFGCLQITGS